jgi:phosphoribosylaminoimidazolecarboxamide formyltransferase/IMP cyclohydrolase
MGMSQKRIKRALISVYDKTGIVEFARALVEEFAIEIISTGGTASLLKQNRIPVTLVEEVTGFPEMMNGRVKTLHPKIHAGILADRNNLEHMRQLEEQGIKPIDMVVVNLYPFEKTVADPNCTFEQAIEMIDIGGPCMLRAAAKNHKHVIACCSDLDHELILDTVRVSDDSTIEVDRRREWASRAFWMMHLYDAQVHAWFESQEDMDEWCPEMAIVRLNWPDILRYGENPHVTGAMYERRKPDGAGLNESDLATAHSGTSATNLSYNNYADGHAALELCKELTRAKRAPSACIFIKHTNACGVSVDSNPVEAYRNAYLGDPNAAMGGILACNFDVKVDFAKVVMETYARFGREAGAGGFFVEVWIASAFDEEALKTIRSAKKWGERVRLLSVGDMSVTPAEEDLEYKSITGGMLVQPRDTVGLNEDQWKVVTKRRPSEQELSDLRLAWLICKHTKSNAITICKDNMLLGNGAGQMSRVMSCRIATWLAKENGHEAKLAGSVAASDAFFPFPDGPTILMDAGVSAIIQPGGSKRDDETITACDERGVAMIMTGTRHFKH